MNAIYRLVKTYQQGLQWFLMVFCFATMLQFAATLPAEADTIPMANAPAGTNGWCVRIESGNDACFGDPNAACAEAHRAWGGPGGFYGATMTESETFALCHWEYIINYSRPGGAVFGCASGYLIEAGPRCVLEQMPAKPCDCARGALADPWSGHPINILTGAKFFSGRDFATADGSLTVDRFFNTMPNMAQGNWLSVTKRSMANWFVNFDVQIQLTQIGWDGNKVATVLNPDGTALNYKRQTDGSFAAVAPPNSSTIDTSGSLQFIGTMPADPATVVNAASQWLFTDKNNTIWTLQTYSNAGGTYRFAHPISAQRADGTTLTFAYDADGAVSTVTDQLGKSYTLTWNKLVDGAVNYPINIASITLPGAYKLNYLYEDSSGAAATVKGIRLAKVQYLDASGTVQDSVSYKYDNLSFPTYITSILDNAGATRWKVTYDTLGHATRSEGPNGELADSLSFSAPGTTFTRTETDALGRQTTYNFSRTGSWDSNIRLDSTQTAATSNYPAASTSNTFSAGFVASSTDEEGRTTTYDRDALGQPLTIVEASGTPQARTTTYIWSPYFNLPTQVTEAGRTTNYTYDGQGRVTQLSMVDTTSQTVPYSTNGQTRTWIYTWGTTGSAKGKLISVNGPLVGSGDTISFTYNANGYLATATDEVGKATTVTAWDWRGAPLSVTDANSVQTTFTYDVHGNLLTATVNPGSSQEQYSFAYDLAGNLAKVTLPKTGYLQYTYDSASRLTQLSNDKGETVVLTPNAMGNPTLSTVKASGGTITQQQSMVYDELGRLIRTLGAASTTPTTFAYDKTGAVKTVTDGRSKSTNNSFDALGRLIQVTNPESQSVKYAYNAVGALTSHKDGRNLETTFITNGFGDVIREVSPDRGMRTYWYDLAGRMIKLVDGDSEETDFAYDNAGRLQSRLSSFGHAAGRDKWSLPVSVVSGVVHGGGRSSPSRRKTDSRGGQLSRAARRLIPLSRLRQSWQA